MEYTVHVKTETPSAPLVIPMPMAVHQPPAPQSTVQFNVDMSAQLRTAIRRKALDLGVPAAVVVREVLEAWVRAK